MIETAKITSKGQLTLPKRVRQHLEVSSGDIVIFELRESGLLIRKLKSVESFFNTLPPIQGQLKEKTAYARGWDAHQKKPKK